MAIQGDSLRLEQQLRLQQRLNPQSVALGRVLEMSEPEFEDEVRRELDDNPALEASESREENHDDEGFDESPEQLQRADYGDDDDDTPLYLSASNADPDHRHVEAASIAPDEGESMVETLMRRLATESELDEGEMHTAAYIIGNLDSNGYMTRRLTDIATDIAMAGGREPGEEEMRRVFEAVRSLEPAGIGAVDLRDCLLLQLGRRDADSDTATACRIVTDFFDLYSKRHFDRLQTALGVDKDTLARADELIRGLNPKPASALGSDRAGERTRHMSPDFTVDYDPTNDSFNLGLTGQVPELGVEASFSSESITDPTAAAFVKAKRDAATTFIQLVQMRTRTLMAILRAIVARQKTFFAEGDTADIRPMILRDIAGDTGLDISVISRATSGKYVLTPHGIYALKSLFNESREGDGDVSTHRLMKVLGDAIEGEDKGNPLSDRELCELLAAQGYDVARRTVAKYRERLGYPVARLRRKI